ncbi:MAG TPA: response regulator [Terriglobales bacterium]|jgi:CheY-like chemotaxis protein
MLNPTKWRNADEQKYDTGKLFNCVTADHTRTATIYPMAAPQVSKRTLRVLVADDGADVVSWLGVLLRQAGYEVRTAVNGREACNIAIEFAPDVALLDIGLPDMDGCDVARAIRLHEGGQRTVLVAATGWGEAEDRERTQDAGFHHHLVKPVQSEQLLKLLASIRDSLLASN